MTRKNITIVGPEGAGKSTLVSSMMTGNAPEKAVVPTLGFDQQLDSIHDRLFYEISGKPRCLKLIALQPRQDLWMICVDLSKPFNPDTVTSYLSKITSPQEILFVACKQDIADAKALDDLKSWLRDNRYIPERDLVITSKLTVSQWLSVLANRIDEKLSSPSSQSLFFKAFINSHSYISATPAV